MFDQFPQLSRCINLAENAISEVSQSGHLFQVWDDAMNRRCQEAIAALQEARDRLYLAVAPENSYKISREHGGTKP